MTDLQFERVFAKAQDLQEDMLTADETKKAIFAIAGFDEGKKVEVTTKQAAIYMNMAAMDFEGNYSPQMLMQLNMQYKENVTIVGENKAVRNKKIKKK